jgi:hypothetical protein
MPVTIIRDAIYEITAARLRGCASGLIGPPARIGPPGRL